MSNADGREPDTPALAAGESLLSQLPRTRPQRSSARRSAARDGARAATAAPSAPKPAKRPARARAKPAAAGKATTVEGTDTPKRPAARRGPVPIARKPGGRKPGARGAAAATRTKPAGAARTPPAGTARPAKPGRARSTASRAKARRATAEQPPVPLQGYASDGEVLSGSVAPPGGAEFVATAAEIVGEIAKAGVAGSERLVKGLLSRFPLS